MSAGFIPGVCYQEVIEAWGYSVGYTWEIFLKGS